ncbi:hypothetical protein DFA_01686 [Cavenderia fasciculata]|uniref:Uncharacterized protein n=1 Tax=Cavenderia fasciculata TaxID=261658 RepID=F4PU85_CACFS|nr:uncharacterized protein DFA_01686 [Cavenderia fasciculata]EGG21800.1 hypothetical protein DFA_01686 [Cavenderia fasciculata]|eukprot:XP_004359650.1 hypothetical protein DFA_01686 [Cavenderia fasciculata]
MNQRVDWKGGSFVHMMIVLECISFQLKQDDAANEKYDHIKIFEYFN